MSSREIVLECAGLTKTYRAAGRGGAVQALAGVDLVVRAGEFVAVTGPSGSGKSTLLHLLGLLDRPDGGWIRLHGDDVTALPPKRLPELRNRRIGFVFQRHHLVPTLSALENVMLPLRYRRVRRRAAQDAAAMMLEAVGLSDRLHHRPGELSGGERQRVAVARALVTEPDLVLADEPTGELDRETAQALLALMRRLNEARKQTFVVATHDMAIAETCDRILRMRDGRIVQVISKAEREANE